MLDFIVWGKVIHAFCLIFTVVTLIFNLRPLRRQCLVRFICFFWRCLLMFATPWKNFPHRSYSSSCLDILFLSTCVLVRNFVSQWLHAKRIFENSLFFFRFVESEHLMVEYGNDLLRGRFVICFVLICYLRLWFLKFNIHNGHRKKVFNAYFSYVGSDYSDGN